MARAKRYGPYNYERILGQRQSSFEAQVSAIVNKTKNNLSIVMRASLQELIDMAQKPVARGGKMRVDTGFLRASGQGSLNGLPTGPSMREIDIKYHYDNGSNTTKVVQLAEMQIGATFYFGWTANYARYREAYDGFLDAGIQQWQSIVDRNIARLNNASAAKRG